MYTYCSVMRAIQLFSSVSPFIFEYLFVTYEIDTVDLSGTRFSWYYYTWVFINFIIQISGQSGIVETVYVTMMFFCEQRAYHVKHSADTTTKALCVGSWGLWDNGLGNLEATFVYT